MPLRNPNLIFMNFLLDEYRDNRIEQASTLTGIVSNIWNITTNRANNMTNMQLVCKDLSEDFAIAHELKDHRGKVSKWIEIILKLGEKAFIVQNVSNNVSNFCTTAHALRTYILTRLKAHPTSLAIVNSKIAELNVVLTDKEKAKAEIPDNAVERVRKVQIATDDCHDVIRKLAYLGEVSKRFWENKTIETIFPVLTYPPQASRNALAPNYLDNLNPNIPFVLHDRYIYIYLDLHFTSKDNEKIDLNVFEQNITEKQLKKMGALEYAETYMRLLINDITPTLLLQTSTLPASPTSSDESPESANGNKGRRKSSTAMLANTFTPSSDSILNTSNQSAGNSSPTPTDNQPNDNTPEKVETCHSSNANPLKNRA
jgi:hypothetical protein